VQMVTGTQRARCWVDLAAGTRHGKVEQRSVSGTQRVRWRVHVAAGMQPRMVEAPCQSLGHNMQRSGCKRSWRHGFGCRSGGSMSVTGT
jgi:hypothetical protein